MQKFYFLNLFLSSLLYTVFSQAQCTTEIGTLPNDTLFICEKGMEILQHNDFELTDNDALIYLLHESSDIETSLDTFFTSEINWQDLGIINWNTNYEISAIAGLDENEDGLPDDLNGECTVVSEAMPVVFAAPVNFEILMDCLFEQENYYDENLCVFKALSFWAISEAVNYQNGNLERSYTITHNINNDTLNMQSFIDFAYTISELDPIVIDFHIRDNYNCIDTLISFDTQYCASIATAILDGLVIITNMPTEQQIICDGQASNIFAKCVYSDFGTSEEYVLSLSSSYDEDSILTTNPNTGSFSILDAQGHTNTELYVIGTLTHGFFGNRAVSEPTPIVFLEPITPQINVIDCNEETGMAIIELWLKGGLPEFDSTALYSIEGDIEAMLQFGQNTILEVPITGFLDWELNLTVSDGNECVEVIEVAENCLVSIEENHLNNYGFSLQNLFPIPAKTDLFLQFEANKNQTILLQLFQYNGSMVMEETANLKFGRNELQWRLKDLSTGIYWLKVAGREGSFIEKVFVE